MKLCFQALFSPRITGRDRLQIFEQLVKRPAYMEKHLKHPQNFHRKPPKQQHIFI